MPAENLAGEAFGREPPKDDSETNGSKVKNVFRNDQVLMKLDDDSVEKVVEKTDLNPSNGDVKEAMVPVVTTAVGFVEPSSSFDRMPPDGHEFPQKYAEKSATELKESTMVKFPGGARPEPEDVPEALPPLPATEPPSIPRKPPPLLNGEAEMLSDKKFFAGSGTSFDSTTVVKPSRNSFWRQDEKSEKSVRDKIAMFSSVPESASSPSNGPGKLSKYYKSSDDVFYHEEADCNRNIQNGKLFSRSIVSLDRVNGGNFCGRKPYGDATAPPRSLDYSNRTQSSMDLCSSSSAYSSSCSPDSSLSSNSSYLGYSSTLPRKKTRNEESKSAPDKKEVGIQRATSFSVHGRSRSLLDVNPTPYKSRYDLDDGQRPGSLNLLIEQRRKNLSKLRGLVIPEKLTDSIPSQPIVDLPEIRSRDLILNSKVASAAALLKEKNANPKWTRTSLPETTVPKVSPSHLWDMQNKVPNIPKYSPAFKRKSISVFGSKELMALNAKKEFLPPNPIKRPSQEPIKASLNLSRKVPLVRQNSVSDDRKYQEAITSMLCEPEVTYPADKNNHRTNEIARSTEIYAPKRKSGPLQGKYRTHSDTGRSEEDSDDNDSAVSSSRSSMSHGFSPPPSPLLDNQYHSVDESAHRSHMRLSPDRTPVTRTASSDTTVSAISTNSTMTTDSQGSSSLSSRDGSGSDASNKRILKPQSVEAINRKNVLASAKYSRGFDVKSGSPLIQRKFSEDIEEVVVSKNTDLLLSPKYSPGGTDAKKESPLKRSIEKIAYVTEIIDDLPEPSEEMIETKFEKFESVPASDGSKKANAPFRYSWENEESAIRAGFGSVEPAKVDPKESPTRNGDASLEKMEKDFSLTNSRMKNSKSSSADCAGDNLSGETTLENSKPEGKDAQTVSAERRAEGNRRSISLNEDRRNFEKPVDSSAQSNIRTIKTGNVTATIGVYNGVNGNHVRVSSLDSTTSEDGPCGFATNNLLREQYGSITSLASSSSLISPQELQILLEEANQTLEETSGSVNGSSNQINHDVLVIILHRDTVAGSIGITLAGGADYESKEITVHKVLAGSPADRDGRLQKGDRILSINGKSMKGVTHRESLAILKSPRLEVVLVVSRLKIDANSDRVSAEDGTTTPGHVRHSFLPGSSRPPRILEQSSLIESDESSAVEEIARGPPVTFVLLKDGAGLGFSLEGGKDCSTGDKPLVVKKIFTGGTAEKSGQLKAGDEILSINGIDVSVMSRIDAWKLMKQLPDGNVTITVRHAVDNGSAE